MLGQIFSQLLASGASKSRADYNTQQQVNQMLREGWVRKGEGGPLGDPMAPDPMAVEEDPMSPAITREGIEALYNAGDPELAKIVNEMLKPGEEYSGGGTPQEEFENVFPFEREPEVDLGAVDERLRTLNELTGANIPIARDRTATGFTNEELKERAVQQLPAYSSSSMEDFISYINSFGNAEQGGNLPQRNLNPVNVKYAENGVANKFARKDSNGNPMTDEHGHLIFPDEKSGWSAANAEIRAKIEGNNRHGLNADSTLAEFGNIYAEDPNWASGVARMLGVDTNTKVGSLNTDTFVETIARQEGWYAGKEIVETPPDNINPDRKSRNFVKKAFKDVRKGIDGLSPTGEEAGHWLKPVAEQLNAMFGKSTPLDMDGFEMGPYHAQRIEHEKMLKEESRHEDRMNLERDRHQALAEHYKSMDQTARERLAMEKQIEFAQIQIDAEKATALAKKINGGHIPSEDDMDYLQLEVEKMLDWLEQEIDDTEIAEYVGGFGYSYIDGWYEGGLSSMMPTLNLMLGFTKEGEEITPDNQPFLGSFIDYTADPATREGIEQRIEFIREVEKLRLNRPELISKAISGQSMTGYDLEQKDRAFIKHITNLVDEVLKNHQSKDPLTTRVSE